MCASVRGRLVEVMDEDARSDGRIKASRALRLDVQREQGSNENVLERQTVGHILTKLDEGL